MVAARDIMNIMETIAPKALAEEWDNPGLLVGSPEKKVKKILVCLDVSDAVVDRAIADGAQMIIAHHPIIFSGLKAIRTDTDLGARLQRLLAADIAVFAAHTNLDIAEGGVNDVLAKAIGLTKLSSFVLVGQNELGHAESMGRIGRTKAPMTIDAFAKQVKKGLGAAYVRVVRAGERPVAKVALCSGSGAEFIGRAAALGADAYVTGDVKYHDAQRATELGLHVIDAGHFPTEFPVAAALVKVLKKRFKAEGLKVDVTADDLSTDFFSIV